MTALLALTPVLLLTLLVGVRGVATMRTTSDFLVASRQVSPLLNSAAVSGEYLSAASFLGIAGMMVRNGVGSLWYAVGFTAGYVVMLVVVAAPLRRSGALTVPDFAESRLRSVRLRRLCAFVVLVIGTLYVIAQFRTAGMVLSLVGHTPYWLGVGLAATTVGITLALGGMRAATYVQALQFGLKVLLFVVPAVVALVVVGSQTRQEAFDPVEFTHFERTTAVTFDVPVRLEVSEPTPVLTGDGRSTTLRAGEYAFDVGQRITFSRGAPVPAVDGTEPPGGASWIRPLVDTGAAGHPLLNTWGVLLATALGTMGLPHVLVRFHTSPTGIAARRTAALTVGLLSVFYLFPGVYGVLGRVLTPELYVSGGTDTAVVALPHRVHEGWLGSALTTMLTAGAFSAILATSLGLMLVISSALAHDFVPLRLRTLRLTGLAAAAVLIPLTLLVRGAAADVLVTWAFTVAASTFCPLLVLGLWSSGLTARGAAAGIGTGLIATSGSTVFGLLGPDIEPWLTSLVRHPALWTVPLAFVVMLAVSRLGTPPTDGESAVLRMHAPRRNVRSGPTQEGSSDQPAKPA